MQPYTINAGLFIIVYSLRCTFNEWQKHKYMWMLIEVSKLSLWVTKPSLLFNAQQSFSYFRRLFITSIRHRIRLTFWTDSSGFLNMTKCSYFPVRSISFWMVNPLRFCSFFSLFTEVAWLCRLPLPVHPFPSSCGHRPPGGGSLSFKRGDCWTFGQQFMKKPLKFHFVDNMELNVLRMNASVCYWIVWRHVIIWCCRNKMTAMVKE